MTRSIASFCLVALGSISAWGQCPPSAATCPPPADNGCGNQIPCPAGCTFNAFSTPVSVSGPASYPPFVSVGDPRSFMNFSINVSASAGAPGDPNCNFVSILLRAWLPDSNGTTAACDTNLPSTFSTCIPFLQAGGPSVLFNIDNTPSLRYTVRRSDEISNPLYNANIPTSFPLIVKAKFCACGTCQDTFTTHAASEREIAAPVLHPAIHIVQSADVTGLCEGTVTPVTYTYEVTATGDVDLINITVSDDRCGPVTPVLNGMFNIGDVDMDNHLDRQGPAGETWVFKCQTSISTTTTTFANAGGTDFVLQIPVNDTDTITIPARSGPMRAGACCIANVCHSRVTLGHCTASGGEWLGAGAHCPATKTCAGPSCPADIALPLNNVVDIDDLVLVITHWNSVDCDGVGDCSPPGGNGIVDIDDLVLVITSWGSCL